MTSSLETLFTTLAQVSFTVSGLMAVAIAGDSEKRNYWFGHESRSLFVYINFLLLLLPGFISIGGLIPVSENSNIPFWTYSSFILGLLYLTLSITFSFKRKKLVEPQEFTKLETKFSKVNKEMGIYGFVIATSSLFGFAAYFTSSNTISSQIETWLGILLLLSTMTGALNSVILLRENEMSRQTSEIISTSYPSKHSNNSNKKEGSGITVFISLVVTGLAFLIGLHLNRRND